MYLYGSQVNGRATPKSDFDLLYITDQKARVDLKSVSNQIYDILGVKKDKVLDVKIYYLWQPRPTLIFPAVIIKQYAKLVYGPDVRDQLAVPNVPDFISFNARDIFFLLEKLKIRTQVDFNRYFLEKGNFKVLYNLTFNLGNIEWMRACNELNCDETKIDSELFKQAYALLRTKWRYEKVNLQTTEDLQLLEEIVKKAFAQISLLVGKY